MDEAKKGIISNQCCMIAVFSSEKKSGLEKLFAEKMINANFQIELTQTLTKCSEK